MVEASETKTWLLHMVPHWSCKYTSAIPEERKPVPPSTSLTAPSYGDTLEEAENKIKIQIGKGKFCYHNGCTVEEESLWATSKRSNFRLQTKGVSLSSRPSLTSLTTSVYSHDDKIGHRWHKQRWSVLRLQDGQQATMHIVGIPVQCAGTRPIDLGYWVSTYTSLAFVRQEPIQNCLKSSTLSD